MERVRVVHGAWDRCLNSHYGAELTAIFLDPPYKAYEKLYGVSEPVAAECEAWAKDNAGLRVALCGHRGDYDLPGWTVHEWDRGRATYAGTKTTAEECIWFSPACLPLVPAQSDLFGRSAY
jgi:16S rRNA G966 N2-methylase RsmD